ncbi:MAG: trypsin-like peptidase domain-containing protein [Gemmataceae bacterium]|nr:trypsin-like peptidase domain-containing protein [Gemmataceae bacterium]MDW8265643.1 trypsin-like peptidase domain-containing protein [Gemmataceae bacterium]
MKRLALPLFLGLCAFVGGHTAAWLGPRWTATVQAQPATGTLIPPSPVASDILRISDRFEAVARRVGPTVVSIEATKPGNGPNQVKVKPVEETGSGVIVRLEGVPQFLVLTNNHVITGARPEQITISTHDGRLLRPGHVWADPESDIALLRLDQSDRLAAATLGDSDQVRVGQWVLAFGSPFGLSQTVTHGIISARERGQVSLGSTIRIKDFLQTDAAINPGSSGGPLVNLDGEVIGINTAIASQSGGNSGVAFSIPVNLVKRVARQLLERGSVSRGYLGLQLAPSFEPADALRLGLDRVQGALVETVYPDTPAAAAGLKPNDVILQLDGTPIRNENHLINWVSTLPVGRRVRLSVWRDRQLVQLEAVIGDWSQAQGRFRTAP